MDRQRRQIRERQMGVLTLAASKGTDLIIETDGTDKKEAIESIIELIKNRFGEDE